MKTKMMFNVSNFFGLVLLLFVLVSCDEQEIKKQVPEPVVPPVVEPNLSFANDMVYAAYDESINGVWVAKVWGPCGPMPLSDGTKDAQTTAVFVSNFDFYVSGWETNSKQGTYAKYWRNGIAVLLTDSTSASFSRATDIKVQGEDVY